MLRKDELAFIKANSQFNYTAVLLMELRKAMTSRQKRKSVLPAGNCSTMPGGGTYASQRSSAQLTGKCKANKLARLGDSSEPATRHLEPTGGTAPLLALVADIKAEQAADRSRHLRSPEDGAMYTSIQAGTFAPKKTSGSLMPTAKGSDLPEPTVSSEADSRCISLSDRFGPLKDKDDHVDTLNHAHLALLDYLDRYFLCLFHHL